MNETKPTLQSKTIRALIVGIIALLAVVGVKLTVTDIQIDQIVEGVGALVVLASMIAGIAGRKSATARLVSEKELIQHERDIPTVIIDSGIPSGPPAPPPKHERSAIFHPIEPPSCPPAPMPKGTIQHGCRVTDHMRYGAFLLSLILLTESGCVSRQEMINQREALVAASEPILSEHQKWAEAIANDPSKLPNLHDNETDAERQRWLKTRQDWHAEYDQTIQQMRANDQK